MKKKHIKNKHVLPPDDHFMSSGQEQQPHGSTMKTRRQRLPSHAGNEAPPEAHTPQLTFNHPDFWEPSDIH